MSEPVREIRPRDPDARRLTSLVFSPDETAYAYSYETRLGDLYVVDGLR